MRSMKTLAGTLAGALALAGVTALGAAAPAAAITPEEALNGTGYGGYSSGEIVHALALGTDVAELARTEVAQSAAGVGVEQGLVDVDTLESKILFADPAGKNAYGHGAGLSLSVGQEPGTTPQTTLAEAEALSPPPTELIEDTVLDVPADPLASAQAVNASAQAFTTTLASACLPNGATLISMGQADAADIAVLTPDPLAPVIEAAGVSESVSETRLVPGADGKFGLTTFTTQTLAPITLLGGTEAAVEIKVLHDIQLRATATGIAGGADVFYGFVRDDGTLVAGDEPVVSITAGGQTQSLTSAQVLGPDGIQLQLGVIDVEIGGPARNADGVSEPIEAGDGTSAFGTADFIRIVSPGTVLTPELVPLPNDGPLGPIEDALDTVAGGLATITGPIQQALIDAGLTAADIRYGHLEALAAVPTGGINCEPPPPPPSEDPLRNAFKDVSAFSVAPGATFDYTIRVPNDGDTELTNVRVVDTVNTPAGAPPLVFVSSDPAPTSRTDNTFTYDLGTIQPGQFRTIKLTFRVPDNAPVGTKYSNSAKITATFEGRQIEKTVNVDGPTVIAKPTGACSVERSTKFASNTEVKTGQEFGYFINVSNTGGQDCTNVTVTDDLVEGVTFVSCSNSCTNSGQRVTFKVGTLTGGSSVALRITVKVTATSGTLPNTGVITTDEGSTARPSTPGPRVTANSIGRPGAPAGCPATGCPEVAGEQLARTGLSTTVPLLALLVLLVPMLLMRGRKDELTD